VASRSDDTIIKGVSGGLQCGVFACHSFRRSFAPVALVEARLLGAENRPLDSLSGSTISLIKLTNIKDDVPIYEDRINLTGVTGHQIQTIGKIYSAVKINAHKLKHAIHVVCDDFPIEQDGILGIDFLRRQSATCDYTHNIIKIGGSTLKLYPSERIRLKPRSETIIRASANRNFVELIQATEITPGFIGNSLIKLRDFKCTVSVINTTDRSIEIQTPVLNIEKYEKSKINVVTMQEQNETRTLKNKQIQQLLQTKYLNAEERKTHKYVRNTLTYFTWKEKH